MTERWEPTEEFDPRFALSARGLLGEFNAAGVLTSADVHVARTLGLLTGEDDDRVLLGVALACRAVRAGSVGLAGLLYLDRYHEQESQVLDDLARRARSSPPVAEAPLAAALERVFPGSSYAEQRAACRRAATAWTTVLTGGPGTGKTTTVAGLLVALRAQWPDDAPPLRVALAAPTGKAAARLQESLGEATDDQPGRPAAYSSGERGWVTDLRAMTLHRLLGRRPGSETRFRHHRGNRLPHDVIVVDETSMVSLTMMARLLEAVRPDARLVLVGDPDQLSSVEAGAVLGDLVRGYRDRPDSPVAELRTSHRFGDRIGALAGAIRDGDEDAALAELGAGGPDAPEAADSGPSVLWVPGDHAVAALREATLSSALSLRDRALAGDAVGALAALTAHRLLCAHREGPAGVQTWNRRVEAWLAAETGESLHDPSYPGRPVLVTANDYAIGVYNGDSGVVVVTDDGPRVAFPGPDGPVFVAPARLGASETMHAMTIHKSQGSQVGDVTVLLPPEDSRLLTRELFYTAVTRARDRVRVVGSEEAVRAGIARRARRASGLTRRLAASAG